MEEYENLSLRARRKKPSVSLSCCFNGNGHRHQRSDSFDAASSSSNLPASPTSSRIMSPSSLKGRYKSLISRMGGRHRRHSADFSYDPLSYSRNFQEEDDNHSDYVHQNSPLRSFASRLPLSPPPVSPTSANSRSQVRNSLELEEDEEEARRLGEIRSSLDHVPISPRKVKTSCTTPKVRSSSSSSSRNNSNDLLSTPPRSGAAAADHQVRRSYDQFEKVSPALVVSPTSRPVLVELAS